MVVAALTPKWVKLQILTPQPLRIETMLENIVKQQTGELR